ncbi:unnamed protein product, partial [Closterium sp. NIES-54]
MASLRVLAFDHEGRPIQFDTWLDDLQLYLLSNSKDSVSLFDHTSGAAPAPPATADSTTRSQWLTRDVAARIAIRNHLPLAECAHFGHHRTAQALYDAVVARYSSPATAALGHLLLPYLFPELSAFATVEDIVRMYLLFSLQWGTLGSAAPAPPRPPFLLHPLGVKDCGAAVGGRGPAAPAPPPPPPPLPPFSYLPLLRVQQWGGGDLQNQPPPAPPPPSSPSPAAGAAVGGGYGGGGCVNRPLLLLLFRLPLLQLPLRGVLLVALRTHCSLRGAPPPPLPPPTPLLLLLTSLVLRMSGLLLLVQKRCSSKGKGGRGGGGGSGGGSGGSSGVGGGSGGSGGGSGGFGGGGGGSGGSGGSGSGGSGGGRTGAAHRGFGGGKRQQQQQQQQQQRRSKTPLPQQLREWFAQRGASGGTVSCPFGVAIFDLDYDAILADMYSLSVSAEGDCYLCVPPDPGIEAAALGASESVLPGNALAEALHTFTLDSGASHCFYRDSTTLTPLSAPVPVRLADPSGGPVLARSSTVLPCPAVPFGSLSGLHLPSFSTNLVSTAALQDAMVTTTIPGGQRVSMCTCTRTGRHLAWFARRPGSIRYTLATEPPQVAVSAQVSASGQVAPLCSCRLLSHQTLLWHHRLGHPSLPRLCGMHSHLLVSGLPGSLPPLLPSPAPPCLPCVKGRQRAAPHSSFPSMTAPLQTLHMDV